MDSSNDELETLTGTSNHLQFITQVMSHTDLSAATIVELHQQIAAIQQRLSDSNLYLAVIGEFSSGKSTLVNAFLRDELLKTSALVTTGVATRLRYGAALQVRVQLKGNRPGIVQTRPDSRQITVPWLPKVSQVDHRQLIDLVTSDPEVTQSVVNVEITHPAKFLSSGIVLIDTPGTNAIQAEHAAITRQVVEQEADAALVIIPATVPLSQTMSDFLRTSLHSYLHRCIFVMTRLDQVRPQEQAALLADVQSRLTEQLGIKAPIHACSAQVLLDDLGGSAISSGQQIWKEQFFQLEAVILDRLRRERLLNIAERLLRLLNHLFEQIDAPLRSQQQSYQQRQQSIQQELIPDLLSFSTQQQAKGQTQIQAAKSRLVRQISQAVEQQRQASMTQIQQLIFDAKEETALDQIVQTQIQTILNQTQTQLVQKTEQYLKTLVHAATQASHTFDTQFLSAYQRLQVLVNRPMPMPSQSQIQLDSATALAGMNRLNQQISQKTGNLALGGMAAGAVIGTTLLPGVGTVIGGVVGGILSAAFAPSHQERQQQLWNQLQPDLDAFFNTAKGQINQIIESSTQAIINALNTRINEYVHQYQETVNTILQEQQAELEMLQHQSATTQEILQEINQRRELISAQQLRLTAL